MNQVPKSYSQILAYIQIIRPLNCLFGSLTVVIGILNAYSGTDFFQNTYHVIALFGGLCVYILIAAASNVINDIFDLNIDSINRPNRPIPSGKITQKSAIIYSSILMGLGIFLSIPLGFFTPNKILIPLLGFFFGFIGFLYNWKGKRSGFMGNVIVGIAFSSGIPFGALLISQISQIPDYLWFFYATAVSLLISRELVKGMEDVIGDTEFQVKTVASVRGYKFTAILSGFFSLIAIITYIIPAIVYSLNVWFMITIGIGNVFVLVSIILLIKPDQMNRQTKASLCLKIAAYVGLIGYILAIFKDYG
ncbi:MAG: geranylgeranylglycerol-phosphate geranylgeranyltransferase [Candidatus Lokiarchaeota archaeon]|nr:geranylgeranylglycerol-phosphate geranylgeranyltransferase [Candidatus Lokiarchaeota archaeon]